MKLCAEWHALKRVFFTFLPWVLHVGGNWFAIAVLTSVYSWSRRGTK
jgi:hypothetical protein